jgi:hypothetical protein
MTQLRPRALKPVFRVSWLLTCEDNIQPGVHHVVLRPDADASSDAGKRKNGNVFWLNPPFDTLRLRRVWEGRKSRGHERREGPYRARGHLAAVDKA